MNRGVYSQRTFFLRSRRQNILLVLSCVATLGTYFIVPFLAVYLTNVGGLTAAMAGTVLSVYLVSSRALMFLAGVLSDKVGAKATMISGLVLTGASYGGLVWAETFPQFCAVMVVSGIGVALFQPSSKSLFIADTPEDELSVAFAWRGAAANLGVAVGGLLASASLVYLSFDGLFLSSAALYAAMVLVAGLISFSEPATIRAGTPILSSVKTALADRTLMVMLLLSTGFWVLYTQLSVTVPLVFGEAGLARALGLVFAFNAGLIVLFQIPISKLISRRGVPAERQFSSGVLVIGAGLTCLALVTVGWPALILFVLLFTLGEMLAVPNLDAIPVALADERHIGTYLGVSATGGAIGTGAGGVVGGILFDLGSNIQTPSLLWVACGACALVITIGSSALLRVEGRKAPEGEA